MFTVSEREKSEQSAYVLFALDTTLFKGLNLLVLCN